MGGGRVGTQSYWPGVISYLAQGVTLFSGPRYIGNGIANGNGPLPSEVSSASTALNLPAHSLCLGHIPVYASPPVWLY